MKNLLYAAILGASLWIISEFLEMGSDKGSTPLSLWMTSIWHPILALGFWGLHKSQSPGKNTLSLIGVVLLIISFLVFAPVSIMILNSPVNSFSEFMEEHPFFQLFGLASVAGYILFGIAMIRTRYFPGWMGYCIIAAFLLGMAQAFAHLPELVQHVAFIGASLIIISMARFALLNKYGL